MSQKFETQGNQLPTVLITSIFEDKLKNWKRCVTCLLLQIILIALIKPISSSISLNFASVLLHRWTFSKLNHLIVKLPSTFNANVFVNLLHCKE